MDSRETYDVFETACRRGYEALFRVNARRATDVRVGAQVLAGAVAGAVHEAARRGTLASPVLRSELVHLVVLFLLKGAARVV